MIGALRHSGPRICSPISVCCWIRAYSSALSAPETPIESALPDVCLPPEQPSPDRVYESTEMKDRVRRAIASLPARERRVIALYYYRELQNLRDPLNFQPAPTEALTVAPSPRALSSRSKT